MAEPLQQSPQDYDPVALFDRVEHAAERLTHDPRTLWSASAESFPVAVGHDGELTDYAPIVSGELSVEYDFTGTYRMTGAAVTVGIIEPGNVEAVIDQGVNWLDSPHVRGFITVTADTELDYDMRAHRGSTAKENGDSAALRLDESDMRAFRREAAHSPGLSRIVNMFAEAVRRQRQHSEQERSETQHRGDYQAIRDFITSAGLGSLSVSSQVPATISGVSDFMEIGQERHFAFATTPGQARLVTADGCPCSESNVIVVEAQRSVIHRQERGQDGQRQTTIGNHTDLLAIASALEAVQKTSEEDYGHPSFNTRLTQRDASRFLLTVEGMRPQPVSAAQEAA
jgi:hypothetical protein